MIQGVTVDSVLCVGSLMFLGRHSLLPLAMATYNSILLSSPPSPAFTSALGSSDRSYRTIASTCPQNDASCRNLPAKSYYTSATAPCCGNTGSCITSNEPWVHSSKPQYCTVLYCTASLTAATFQSLLLRITAPAYWHSDQLGLVSCDVKQLLYLLTLGS